VSDLPKDGSLSGEELPDEDDLARMAAMMANQMNQPAQSGWRPGCASCLNGHKLAIGELTAKLNGMGLSVSDPAFMQAFQAARQAGMMFAQNPMAAIGQNGTKPDMIPPIRAADVMVGGTSLCMICYMPQKQTSLLLPGAGWTPSSGR